jgi:hypothetical protein
MHPKKPELQLKNKKTASIGGTKPIGASAAAPPKAAAPAAAAVVAAAPTTPAAPAPASAYKVGDVCEAMWTDGKWYTALIKAIAGPKITVTYMAYGNTTALSTVALRPLSAEAQKKALAAAAAPKGGAGAKGGAKAAPKAAPKKAAAK